jgi:DNA-binding Lrp family transcriptional regulator
VSKPYRQVAALAGLPERVVMFRLERLLQAGVIKRLGVIVRHHECGFRHNAMAVWDVPDEWVDAVGRRLAAFDSVRLCYRRPRRRPQWPYNLFCMIHGRDRDEVLKEIARIESSTGLDRLPGDVLFSIRRFKQRGARYDLETSKEVMKA